MESDQRFRQIVRQALADETIELVRAHGTAVHLGR